MISPQPTAHSPQPTLIRLSQVDRPPLTSQIFDAIKRCGLFICFSALAGLLAACGGGSGGDTTAPAVTLNGPAAVTIAINSTYVEQGATFSDAVDGAGQITNIAGSVNAGQVGTYILTYSKSDAAGNTGTAQRTVEVVDPMPTGPVLADVTRSDLAGGSPIIPVNVGGVVDTLSRPITYTATGLPDFPFPPPPCSAIRWQTGHQQRHGGHQRPI